MKKCTNKILIVLLPPLSLLLGYYAFNIFYGINYGHRHCIVQTSAAFKMYSANHQGQLPFSTNGFGNALLLLVKEDLVGIPMICGPDDDGHVFKNALTNDSVIPEEQCSRVYIQGLNDSNDPSICIFFDRNSCKGGDHGRSPWGHRVRESCLLDGSRKVIRDEDWPDFSRKQVELLIAAGFSRTNARYFYPAAE